MMSRTQCKCNPNRDSSQSFGKLSRWVPPSDRSPITRVSVAVPGQPDRGPAATDARGVRMPASQKIRTPPCGGVRIMPSRLHVLGGQLLRLLWSYQTTGAGLSSNGGSDATKSVDTSR